ncbi:MAG TPA: ATP-binding protein [Anaerolineaceae bacterium]
MRELALHLLDIAENSVAAQAKNITLTVVENISTNRLRMTVEDDGKGMDNLMIAQVVDPFVTSRTTRKVGLGIPLLKAAAEACDGFLNITSAVDQGTTVVVEFQHSNIDRMPLGDLSGTILTLVIAFPQIHWKFDYRVNDKKFEFDDQTIKEILNGVPLTEPDVLAYIRKLLQEGVSEIKSELNRIQSY